MTTALEGVRGQRHAPAALYPGKDLVPIVQEAGWAPGSVWTGAENLAPTGIRSSERPASRYTDYGTRPNVKVKVKFTLEHFMNAQRGVDIQLYSLTSAIDGVDGQRHAPPRLFTRGKVPVRIL